MGVARFVSILRRVKIPGAVINAILAIFVLLLGLTATGPAWHMAKSKSNMKNAVRQVSENTLPGDMVVLTGGPGSTVYNFYRDVYYPNAPLSTDFDKPLPKLIHQIEKSKRIWLVPATTPRQQILLVP